MAIGGFGTISQQLGSAFGGKSYTNSIGSWGWRWLMNRPRSQQDFVDPSSPSPTPDQQILPTSKYGDTIPVVYGLCRIPGAYIWAPDFDAEATTGEVITTLRARIRFARPLVADSNWLLRRLWSNGKLIWSRRTGYRSPTITRLRAYGGKSNQARDSLQVEVEGEDNVSAHRGYLDMVITMQLSGERQPPSFDGEWIQDAEISTEDEIFDSVLGPIDSAAFLDTASDTFYAHSGEVGGPFYIRRFSIAGLSEIYAVEISGGVGGYSVLSQFGRYLPTLDRIIMTGRASAIRPWLLNPLTGVIEAEGDPATSSGLGEFEHISLPIMWGTQGIFITVGESFRELATFQIGPDTLTRTYLSAGDWDGRGEIEWLVLGEQTGSSATVYASIGDTIYKFTATPGGAITGITTFVTLATDLTYMLYREDTLYVWDSDSHLIRYNTSGTVLATWTVPYDMATTNLPPPDMLSISDRIFVNPGLDDYHLTNLEDGTSESFSDLHFLDPIQVWLDDRNTIITSASDGAHRTILDLIGDGTIRNLSDFIAAVWESDDDFAGSEHNEIGIDDQINGAVIDITQGKREIVRNLASAYSFSIFERAGQIICKRANTDGSFAVDVTIASTDLADRGGQAIRATKINPEERIARFGITHRDPVAIYQALTQFGEIQWTPFPVSPTDLSVKQDVPVIASATRMKTLATKKVHRLAEESHGFLKAHRAKDILIEPEDIEQFSYAGRTINARVTEVTINPDFTIEVGSTEFLSKVETTVEGSSGRPTEPVAVGTPASTYYHLDIPIQEDVDDLGSAGLVQYHVLTSQGQPDWDGATLYRQDASYLPVSSQILDGLVGIAQSALPDTDNPYVTEFTRTLDVAFITGDPTTVSTATYLEVMNGANKFAIGAPGRWEVVHVIEIDDNGDGTFTFTGFVRGRGVSEEHTGTHETGDYVVYLGSNVQHLEYGLDALGDAFNFKAVGSGGNITLTPAVSRTISGEAEKIPKPAQLNASIDSPSDVRLSWERRARFGAIWDDDGIYSTPLNETLEQYVIRIKDGPGGTVKRTVTVDDATFYDYSGAFQITDFGGALISGDELTFDIRQVSGSGVISPTREATITL